MVPGTLALGLKITIAVGAAVVLIVLIISTAVAIVKYRRRGYIEIPDISQKKFSLKGRLFPRIFHLIFRSRKRRCHSTNRSFRPQIRATHSPGRQWRSPQRFKFHDNLLTSPGTWKDLNVAIKRIAYFEHIQVTEKFMEDFLFEIKIMSSLDHKNILKFLGASITKTDEVFLVAELMENGSIRDLLSKTDGHLDWKLKIRLAVDAARGMMYLHSRKPPIIHRDLKSSNLLIDKQFHCKVADFGVSRLKPTTELTMTVVGTPAYMAPEVISKNKYTESADVYSFGVVLVELLSGKTPYHDMTLFPQQVMYAVVQEGLRPSIPKDCPPALEILIKECLDQEPAKRPPFPEIKARLKRM